MYENWLKPAPPPDETLPTYSFGRHLQQHARQCPVGLIGLNEQVANKVRTFLNRTVWDFDGLPIADLGNLRKTTTEFAIPLLRELHASGITPILIGGSPKYFASQYLSFNELNRQVSLLNIDSQVELSNSGEDGKVLDPAIHRKGRKAFHLTHIGSQQHLVDPAIWKLFDANSYEAIRLGLARKDIADLEPQIRDADIASLNIRALHHNDAPARKATQPSGFDLQETCQMAYYAGNSDKLNSFGVYGLNTKDTDQKNIDLTAASYAQLIWYFLQGFSRRAGDFPITTERMMEYVVEMDDTTKLTFLRSPTTNRWWCEIPLAQFHGDARHRLIACSYQDYLTTSSEQVLPDRLVAAFRRYA
ncbi:arginase family protein [Neolewinella antarctica]|uniref:Arginase n=1 Tax=Neolewinella antarctica TaxID=442734 RepID=A0ABX0XAA0_9BACT|nr:hypothetical protein [Neolewinella antarctica]NJC26199.1 hypothetical protein [Neolewinella antarctica]